MPTRRPLERTSASLPNQLIVQSRFWSCAPACRTCAKAAERPPPETQRGPGDRLCGRSQALESSIPARTGQGLTRIERAGEEASIPAHAGQALGISHGRVVPTVDSRTPRTTPRNPERAGRTGRGSRFRRPRGRSRNHTARAAAVQEFPAIPGASPPALEPGARRRPTRRRSRRRLPEPTTPAPNVPEPCASTRTSRTSLLRERNNPRNSANIKAEMRRRLAA